MWSQQAGADGHAAKQLADQRQLAEQSAAEKALAEERRGPRLSNKPRAKSRKSKAATAEADAEPPEDGLCSDRDGRTVTADVH